MLIKEQKSAHVNPQAACYGLYLMLEQPPVSGLVVPRMEAILEDGRLDVVALLAFLEGDGLDLPAGDGLRDLLLVEVTPCGLSVIVGDGYLPGAGLDGSGDDYLTGLLVHDFQCLLILAVKVKAGWLALYTVGDETEPVGLILGKLAVGLALVGSVCMDGFDLVTSDLSRAFHGILDEAVVSSAGWLYGNVSDEVGLILLIAGLCDVCGVALHLLTSLATIVSLWVVGVLHALGADLALVADCYSRLLVLLILLIEHTAEQRLLTFLALHEDEVNYDAQTEQALMHGLRVVVIDCLGRILGIELKGLFPHGLVGDGFDLVLCDLLAVGLLDKLIAGVPGDIARDKLTVHTDALARDAVLSSLGSGNLLETLLEKVHAMILLVLADSAAEAIVGVKRRALLIQRNQAKRLAEKQVETAVLIQLFVTAPAAFLEDAHRIEYAGRSIGAAVAVAGVAFCVERLEDALIHLRGHLAVELVVPGIGGIILLTLTLAHEIGRGTEHVQLLVCGAFLEHSLYLLGHYKYTKNLRHGIISKSEYM